MKRTIVFLLVCVLVLSTCNLTSAQTDYEQSFAKDDIEELISKGIICENNGNVYPENQITRAEFVKIINRAFGFTEKANENFVDVLPNEWYYDEFRIAKKQGYLTGDSLGLAKPNDNITRCEVAVILTRVLKVDEKSAPNHFSDKDRIPDWALDSINTLVSLKIVSGYPDGTFRPFAFMTRAEGFALINRILNQDIELPTASPTPTETQKPTSPPVPITGGGSSGSGNSSSGSGSSGSANKKVSLPIINQLSEEDSLLRFTTIANAVSYTITASYDTFSNSIEIAESSKGESISVDLSDLIEGITDNVKLPELPIDIFIQSNAKDGYIDSANKKIGTIVKKFVFLDVPSVTVEKEQLPSAEVLKISWDAVENAEDYSVKLIVDKSDITSSILVNKKSRVAVVKDISILSGAKEVKFEISATSNTEGIMDSMLGTTYIDYEKIGDLKGDGSEENPYIIKTSNDFELIRSNPDKHFLLVNDIKIENNFEPFTDFTGSLKGYDLNTNTPKKRVVQININQPDSDNVGLFKNLSGSAVIDSIVVDGSISGKGMVGAIAGACSSGNISITNCVNRAMINATGNNCGGILGSLSVTGSSLPIISACSNLSRIESTASNVGGIIGFPNIASPQVGIINCSNYGEVIGVSNVGGIIGAAYAGVSKSFNAGYVESTAGGAGGIASISSRTNDPITYCYNVGKVKSASVAGGIAYGPANASSSILIKYCYFAGTQLEGNVNAFPISTTNSSSSLSNNLYVFESNSNQLPGTISVTLDELKDASNINTKILLDGEDEENKFIMMEGYDLPQIPTNLFGESHLNLPVCAVTNLSATNTAISWSCDDPLIMKYEIQIYNKDTYDLLINETVDKTGAENESYAFSFEANILYEVLVTSVDSNGNHSEPVRLFVQF